MRTINFYGKFTDNLAHAQSVCTRPFSCIGRGLGMRRKLLTWLIQIFYLLLHHTSRWCLMVYCTWWLPLWFCFFFTSNWLTNVDGVKDLWCSKYSLAAIYTDMNGRVCGTLVQFGYYQHRHEWTIHIQLSLEIISFSEIFISVYWASLEIFDFYTMCMHDGKVICLSVIVVHRKLANLEILVS